LEKVLVKNAADREQVREAKQKETSLRDRELNDLRSILNTREGRRYLWRMMGHCRTFASVWHASAQIHYNAGMQDVGHFMMAEITEASPEAFFLMMKENKGD